MGFRCFKKLAPSNAVRLPGGTAIKFQTTDGVEGFYATQDPRIQGVLADYVRQGEYGLSEISEADFHVFLEKKSNGLNPPGREEFSPTSLSKSIHLSNQLQAGSEAAAVSGPVAPPPVAAVITTPPPATPVQAPTNPEVKLNVGRRRAGRRKPQAPPD